jgi:hypothetical protein
MVLSAIAGAAHMMELNTWDEVYAVVSNTLWVRDVLDKEFESLRPLVLMDRYWISRA